MKGLQHHYICVNLYIGEFQVVAIHPRVCLTSTEGYRQENQRNIFLTAEAMDPCFGLSNDYYIRAVVLI